jgi:hypothetical protein
VAGLPRPTMIAAARVESGPLSPAYDLLTGIVRSLSAADRACRHCDRGEIGIETLADRLRQDAVAHERVVFLPRLVCAGLAETNICKRQLPVGRPNRRWSAARVRLPDVLARSRQWGTRRPNTRRSGWRGIEVRHHLRQGRRRAGRAVLHRGPGGCRRKGGHLLCGRLGYTVARASAVTGGKA